MHDEQQCEIIHRVLDKIASVPSSERKAIISAFLDYLSDNPDTSPPPQAFQD